MKITGIKTHIVKPGDSLFDLLDRYIVKLPEASIVAITSKIVSICERRIISKDKVSNKYDLITQEADAYLAENKSVYDAHLTIKQNRIIPSAGIDESNGNGCYILYPKNSQQTAEGIWQYLRKKHQLNNLGVILTDSHVTPLCRGVTGMAIGWCGFQPLFDYVGNSDIFNNPLRMTKINILDALATTAVFIMGEGAEQIPLVTINHAPRISFVARIPTLEEKESIKISLQEDLFAPLLCNREWQQK